MTGEYVWYRMDKRLGDVSKFLECFSSMSFVNFQLASFKVHAK